MKSLETPADIKNSAQLYTSSSCPAETKAALCSKMMEEVFLSRWKVEPQDVTRFDMEISAVHFDNFVLSRSSISPTKLLHVPEKVRASSERVTLHVATRRQIIATEESRIVLQPDDFIFLSSLTPRAIWTEDSYVATSLSFPMEQLFRYAPLPKAVIGRQFSSNEGLSAAVSSLLNSMAALGPTAAPEILRETSCHLLEIFGLSYALQHNRENAEAESARLNRREIKAYIEKNLSDPNLNVESIASTFGVSTRYIQGIFAVEGEAPSRYIRRRRLENCRKHIMSVAWERVSITQIAFNWGFNNVSHFARSFKEEYGVSARQLRHVHS